MWVIQSFHEDSTNNWNNLWNNLFFVQILTYIWKGRNRVSCIELYLELLHKHRLKVDTILIQKASLARGINSKNELDIKFIMEAITTKRTTFLSGFGLVHENFLVEGSKEECFFT